MAEDERKIQACVMLPRALYREVKIRAAEIDCSASDLLEEGARIVLKRKRRKRPADARASA